MKSNEYCVLVISHGRPECRTLQYLPGVENVYILCDDEDTKLEEYRAKYGERVLVFPKEEYIRKTDWAYNKVKRNHPVYARNAAYDVAKNLGYRYFFVVDDDMKGPVRIRYSEEGKLKAYRVKDLGGALSVYVDFMKAAGAAVVGICGSGDFIGGKKGRAIIRELQNFYLCDADNPLEFKGIWIEDYPACVIGWGQGKRTICPRILMAVFKAGEDSVTEYGDDWAFNFSPVMLAPVSVSVARRKGKFANILKQNYYPMIISERWKK